MKRGKEKRPYSHFEVKGQIGVYIVHGNIFLQLFDSNSFRICCDSPVARARRERASQIIESLLSGYICYLLEELTRLWTVCIVNDFICAVFYLCLPFLVRSSARTHIRMCETRDARNEFPTIFLFLLLNSSPFNMFACFLLLVPFCPYSQVLSES